MSSLNDQYLELMCLYSKHQKLNRINVNPATINTIEYEVELRLGRCIDSSDEKFAVGVSKELYQYIYNNLTNEVKKGTFRLSTSSDESKSLSNGIRIVSGSTAFIKKDRIYQKSSKIESKINSVNSLMYKLALSIERPITSKDKKDIANFESHCLVRRRLRHKFEHINKLYVYDLTIVEQSSGDPIYEVEIEYNLNLITYDIFIEAFNKLKGSIISFGLSTFLQLS